VSWQIEKGSMDAAVKMENGGTVDRTYHSTAGEQADFYPEIPETGSYLITVAGHNAKGETEFQRTGSDQFHITRKG